MAVQAIRGREILIWAAIYAVLTLLTQLGAVTREVINWDESTFMLLGSDVLEGTLPYIQRFDNKPPMIFFIFAGWMGVFGQSVLSARLLGDACIALSALLIFLIARRYADTRAAGAAGALYVAMHAIDPGLHTSAGLPAIMLLMAALWLILAWRERPLALALAGVLVSLAVLTRSNMAYVALASGLWFLAMGLWRPGVSGFYRWSPFAYAAGGLVPVLILVILYGRADALVELKLASIDVALNYSDQWGILGAGMGHIRKWGQAAQVVPLIYVPFTILALCATATFLWKPARNISPRMSGHDWAIVWVILAAMLFSILKSGAVFTYYWQQFYPLVALLIAVLIQRLNTHRLLHWGAIFGVALTVTAGVARTSVESFKTAFEPGYLDARHDIKEAAEILRPLLQPEDRIWALDRHLILVYLDHPTVSRVVAHPSNITQKAIMTTLSDRGYVSPNELRFLLTSQPEFLVSNGHDHLFYFGDQDTIKEYIAQNYYVIHATDLVTIYRRNNTPQSSLRSY